LPGTDKEAAPPFLVRRAVPLNKHDIMKNKIALPSIILASLLATGFLRAGDAKPAAPVVIPPEDAAAGGWADSGPLGFYFANPDFKGDPAFSRRDVRIAFDWGQLRPVGGSPAEPYQSFPGNHFSIRWTGRLLPRFSEEYTFVLKTSAATGATLKIKPSGANDWKTVIAQPDKKGVARSAPVRMDAGKICEVAIEYSSSKSGEPGVELRWSSPSAPEQVIDPAVAQGLNADTWSRHLWADETKVSRFVDFKGDKDELGWLKCDGGLFCLEGQSNAENTFAGTYLLSFRGQADVSVNRGRIEMNAGGQSYKQLLPRGAGYDPATNTTRATFVIPPNQGFTVNFKNTSRQGNDPKGDGVTDVRVMRPATAGGETSHREDEIVFRPFKAMAAQYTCLRILNIANVHCQGLWKSRTLPAYQSFTRGEATTPDGKRDGNNGGECWEMLVALANECGKDLYLTLPMQADDDYFEKIAKLLKYGSDGVTPYDHEVKNPKWPPLNPNLRVYIEVGNEIWNWAFASTQDCMTATKKEVADGTVAGKMIDYDGNGAAAYRRWHVLRTVKASETFRRICGDAAMGGRIRLLMEYQYDNAQNTATSSFNFMDRWFNNGDGEHVKQPHPVRYWVWGGGGATYYGVGNPDGHQNEVKFSDPSFENGVVPDGQEIANPKGSGWICSGSDAAIYRNGWTTVADFDIGTFSRLRAYDAVGSSFQVKKQLYARALGAWVGARAGEYTMRLIGPDGKELARTRVKPLQFCMTPTSSWVWGAIDGVPVKLVPGQEYRLYMIPDRKSEIWACAEPFPVTSGENFEITGLLTAKFQSADDQKSWKETSQPGAVALCPVGVLATTGPDTLPTPYYEPFLGGQAAVLHGGGKISTKVTFPKAGHYALELHASGTSNAYPGLLAFRVTVDGSSINPLGQSDARLGDEKSSFAIGGFERRTNQPAEVWGSGIFNIDTPGEHEIAVSGEENPRSKEAWTMFDYFRVVSVDALLDSGFGAGAALGQVAQDNYAKQLNSQAIYARSFGLPVVAYEAGWSLGGDFNAKPIHTWSKFKEEKARAINNTAEEMFQRAGSFMNVWGVYIYAPFYDINNAMGYPLMQSLADIAGRLPAEPDNGSPVPGKLDKGNVSCNTSGNREVSLKNPGDWCSWLVIAPASGVYTLNVAAQSDQPWLLEVDGIAVASPAQARAGNPYQVSLVKGLHAVRLRGSGPVTLDSISVEK